MQVAPLQVSVVQAFASSQSPSTAQGTQVGSGVVCTQVPALQASVVQWFPSLQRLPSSVWPLQSLSTPSQTSGPVELWSRALPVVSKTLTPAAPATFVKSPSLQLGVASALIWTLTVAPPGSAGTFTTSGFGLTTVHVTFGSLAETVTAMFDMKAGRAGSSIVMPLARPRSKFWTAIV